MAIISFGFSRNSKGKIGSRILCWAMRKKFSHTFFMFKEKMYSDRTVQQSTGHGVASMSETRFLQDNIIVQEFPVAISEALFDEILQECHKYAGCNYGYLQNLGVAIVRLAAKLGIKINKNPLDDGMNCSEWMCYILDEIYGKWTTKDPNLVGPDDVYAFLESKGLT